MTALAADAAIGNVQEQLMRTHGVSGTEMVRPRCRPLTHADSAVLRHRGGVALRVLPGHRRAQRRTCHQHGGAPCISACFCLSFPRIHRADAQEPAATTLAPTALFAVTGYFGLSLVLIVIRTYGAFIAVTGAIASHLHQLPSPRTVTNLRKLATVVRSIPVGELPHPADAVIRAVPKTIPLPVRVKD